MNKLDQQAQSQQKQASDNSIPTTGDETELRIDGQGIAYSGRSHAVAMSHHLKGTVNEVLKYQKASHAYSLWYSWLLD